MATNLAAALTQALDASFPRVAFTMAYGSGVFQQKNHDASASMVDLVFAVDDPRAWHAQNLERNPQHYSALKYLGAANVAAFQKNFGAGVYYNTLKIAGISYLGDFRMTFGENPKKVRNIVDGNLKSFHELYKHKIQVIKNHALIFVRLSVRLIICPSATLQTSPFMSRSLSDGDVLIANSSDLKVRQNIVESLPSNVLKRLATKSHTTGAFDHPAVTKKQLQRVIATIVFRSSRSQSIKGIATAGGVKSIVYVAQKLKRTYFK
ncbi:unnamed protein product [Phytophthora fragariaefolia]|uniref:Phosphatidate cytidylyltransferase, mitochondrial n=1 Tax=Phytophthora fragariaefolia TaxID=1490495 RepID=A0A9W6Y3K0_9STRA|nr:unnamed protein product [Phytophthora fragariaefolia]